jgi:hypothetical protein
MSGKLAVIPQDGFTYGEVDPEVAHDMSDGENFKGCRKFRNVFLTKNSVIVNRCGTRDRGAATSSGNTKSFTFAHSNGQCTIVEFTALRIKGIDGLGALNTATAFVEADIPKVDAVVVPPLNSADSEYMVIVCEGYEPKALSFNRSTLVWSYADLSSLATGTPWWDAVSGDVSGEYPVSVGYCVQRLIFVTKSWFCGTCSSDPFNFNETAPTDTDTYTYASGSAFHYQASEDSDSGFRWVRSANHVMGGSPRGAWLLSNYTNVLDQQNPNMKNLSQSGAWKTPGIAVDSSFIYFAGDGSTCKSITVSGDSTNGVSITASVMNKLFSSKFRLDRPKKNVYQNSPDTIMWVLTEAGKLYSLGIGESKLSWTYHELPTGVVVSDICLYSNEEGDEKLYLWVTRNGNKRVEVLDHIFPFDAECFFDDYSTFDYSASSVLISGESSDVDGSAKYTATAHGFVTNDVVKVTGIPDLSNEICYIYKIDNDTFKIAKSSGAYVEYGLYESGMSVTPAVKEITYPRFANQTVLTLQNGYFERIDADPTGKLVFSMPVVTFFVGYDYQAYIVPRSFQKELGTSKGQIRQLFVRVWNTKGFFFGESIDGTLKNSSPLKEEDGESVEFTGLTRGLNWATGMNYEVSCVIKAGYTPMAISMFMVELNFGGIQ